MSRSITTKTELSVGDKALVISALNRLKEGFEESNNVFTLNSGRLRHTEIDLNEGTISGDEDFLWKITQAVGEEKFRETLLTQGGSIISRSVNQEQEVVLMWTMNG